MRIRFTKMHGLGNDFVVIDGVRQQVRLSPEQARFLADRRFGVGCDQILLVEPPGSPGVAFRYRILNADGSEVFQCGNGARCFARFVHEQGLTDLTEIPVETASGRLVLKLLPDGEVLVNMGMPEFAPERIPFQAEEAALLYPIQVGNQEIRAAALSIGNPHVVLLVESVDSAPVEVLGPALESHSRFPERVNVGFMQVIDRQHIRLRVYERGAGETLACGSGACAAVVAGRRLDLLDEKVKVDLPGGQLIIEWRGASSPVMMTGPATTVFEGNIDL
jgi:diaminopimelate epimerase